MVMTGIQKMTFDKMKEAKKRIFGSVVGLNHDYSLFWLTLVNCA